MDQHPPQQASARPSLWSQAHNSFLPIPDDYDPQRLLWKKQKLRYDF